MTKEEKQILLKDLCGRLPYGVKVVDLDGWVFIVKGIDGDSPLVNKYSRFGNTYYTVGYGWKPYLRPMSSMTDEEKQKYYNLTHQEDDDVWAKCLFDKMVDFCNERHLDYRGLIEKGLALEAPEDMYKNE